ncbi:hypothetical protein [Candidatus Mycolicibacterium alkanivorans]|nr:hypothetical protein [Candidatus Mycolicibacterium alkanivorans]
MRTFALVHPIATGLALVLAAGTFRVLDIWLYWALLTFPWVG